MAQFLMVLYRPRATHDALAQMELQLVLMATALLIASVDICLASVDGATTIIAVPVQRGQIGFNKRAIIASPPSFMTLAGKMHARAHGPVNT